MSPRFTHLLEKKRRPTRPRAKFAPSSGALFSFDEAYDDILRVVRTGMQWRYLRPTAAVAYIADEVTDVCCIPTTFSGHLSGLLRYVPKCDSEAMTFLLSFAYARFFRRQTHGTFLPITARLLFLCAE